MFLDDDAAGDPHWLARLTAPYADSAVPGVGGSAAPRWPTSRTPPATLPCPQGSAHGELDWVVGCTYPGQPTALEPAPTMMGCNVSFRTDVFRAVGGLPKP